MYKSQLRFQKIICLIAVIVAAVYFVYALGILTDIHDALKDTMRNKNDYTQTKVPGSIIFYDMQPFNKLFVNLSIGLILLSCFLFVMNTHVRRKYYIGNYVAIGAYSAGALALTVWSHLQIAAFANQFMTTVDFAAMKEYSDRWGSLYLDNTFLLDLHYVVGGAAILTVAGLIFNMVWKIKLMREEEKLIAEGKEALV
jgi:hypothetical protein